MRDKKTFNCSIDGVKVQFLYYPYHLLEERLMHQNIFISSLVDIACTKLISISDRGYKKDFIDLYFLLHHFLLEDLFKALNKKYRNVKFNEVHILKSLLYFKEADEQPMPRMLHPISWDEIKHYIMDITDQSKIIEAD